MIWRLCTFEPYDVVANADARSLATGGFGSEGEISPLAFAGALRTTMLRRLPGAADDEVGRRLGVIGEPTEFHFAGPLLRSSTGSVLAAAPGFLRRSTEPDEGGVLLGPAAGDETLTDDDLAGARLLEPPPGSPRLEVEERLLSLADLCGVLGGAAQEHAEAWRRSGLPTVPDPIEPGEVFRPERRHGHRRGPYGVAADGLLFSRAGLRFRQTNLGGLCSAGYAGLLSGVADLLPDGCYDVRLAGDGRLARLEVAAPADILEPVERLRQLVLDTAPALGGLLVYLLTPALFEGGWHPGREVAADATLEAAAVGRARPISGWSLAGPRPGPRGLSRAVPAGSTYFYRLPDDVAARAATIDRLLEHHLGKPVTQRHAGLGFGAALIGVWKPSTDRRGV